MTDHTNDAQSTVLVIGGGVGGIKAAMDLSEARKDVLLVDKAAAIGGLMTQLDRTFPTNNCDLCTISPHLSAGAREQHIELMPLTEVTALAGDAGDFTVTLTSAPRYIDLDKCTACGECHKQYPECVRFYPGLDHRAPTCMRYPQATPQAFSIDMAACKDVDALVKVCPAGAIVVDDQEKEVTRRVSSIILAVGAELFDPGKLDHFGHGRYPNVVTGLEYERIMSASGPTLGNLVRPSDGQAPKRVAWIQCAGSRGINREDVSYCSSVCCMYALKEAIVTKERFQDDIETTIFFMDMRTFGKDYEAYYQRAKEQYNIRMVRCRPHSIVPDPGGQEMRISYATDEVSGMTTENFDMVVLSTGFRPAAHTVQLAETLGIALNTHQFVQSNHFEPVVTSRPGIYVCGVSEGPKDIPETMVQASAAACMAARHTDKALHDVEENDEYPPERDVFGEAPRIGVFVCDCGQNIGGAMDVEALVQESAKYPHVVHAEMAGHGCGQEALARMRRMIEEKKLNRVVVGACSPRTHEGLFQENLRKAGLNKYLLEIANIRDQNAWVHGGARELATAKGKKLIRMAVGAVAQAGPLREHTLPMNKDVLVLGGGVAGMNSALSLGDQGYKVFLAERTGRLGGLAAVIRRNLEGDDVRVYVAQLVERVQAHDNIEVITNAIVVDHSGMPGKFQTGFQIGPRMYYRQIEHGATVLATGALAHRPNQYLLGRHKAVMTQLDLDDLIEAQPDRIKDWECMVMIQCVGSRTAENPNCSRICCQTAIKNALRLTDLNPEMRVFVLYRDMRTYGFSEDAYIEARRRGVIFVRYEAEKTPQVTADGDRVTVQFDDPILGRPMEVSADCLGLSTGLIADDETTEDLAAIFHLNRTEDGHFLEDHVKLKPLDMSVPGFFVAGTAHSPRSIAESIAQAQGVAGRIQGLLSQDVINLGAVVARVDRDKCATCLVCVRACPYNVPFINEDRYSEIDPAKCHGCGTCAAECPAKAIQLSCFEDAPIMAKLEGLLERIA
ncbi:FAD-dependent oxidoreductase [Desulfatitalea alkaliphila]|uniref:FAD-dependent oxidoreductase n=1 Tax=Desulfatitalea alkaliphila TaxID=2929485 RepID=A0AA41R0V1_9BACT|nr:FAD-dependent oxidoreductase [Desulfatitalea alkaliphila]MCJ8500792.1 FAD-dependent oxidoreductase [Desulfatitalea alkaliphila]